MISILNIIKSILNAQKNSFKMPTFCVDLGLTYAFVCVAVGCCIKVNSKSSNVKGSERDLQDEGDAAPSVATAPPPVKTVEPLATVTTPLLQK